MDQASTQSQVTSPDLFIFAGEASGDRLGAELLKELLQLHPSLSIGAVAGPAMRNYPITEILPMENFQVMGFVDVLVALPRMIKLFKMLKTYLLRTQPKAILFIDYPGFNLRMQRHLRKAGFKGALIHYVCPSVWAWKKNRIHPMSSYLNLLLSVFPFEKECFKHTPLQVEYIGHPLAEPIHHFVPSSSFPKFPLPILAIFPGSRKKEILRNFPLQLQAAIDLAYADHSIVVSCAHPHLLPLLEAEVSRYPERSILILSSESNYDLMHHAKLALATSGTITLELALHEVPTVVTYALSALDEFLATHVFRIHLPHYCIVNYTANMRIFPELYGSFFQPKMLYETLTRMLNHSEELKKCEELCSYVKSLLYKPQASAQAAQLILRQMEPLHSK